MSGMMRAMWKKKKNMRERQKNWITRRIREEDEKDEEKEGWKNKKNIGPGGSFFGPRNSRMNERTASAAAAQPQQPAPSKHAPRFFKENKICQHWELDYLLLRLDSEWKRNWKEGGKKKKKAKDMFFAKFWFSLLKKRNTIRKSNFRTWKQSRWCNGKRLDFVSKCIIVCTLP